MRHRNAKSAGVLVYRGEAPREYLLVRSARTRRPIWEFPKGAIEEGEAEEEAACRELLEETGLGSDCYRLVPGFRADERYTFLRGRGAERTRFHKEVTYFLARWLEGEVRISPEAMAWEWADPERAASLVRLAGKRRVLEAAERWLSERRGKTG